MSSTTTPDTTATFTNAPKPGDFQTAIALLSVLGEANRRLEGLTSKIESGYLEIVSNEREAYAKLQETVTENEAALEVIARRNPQWFADKKSVVTPYGSVKFKSSKELVIANEESSIVLILASKRRELVRRSVELNKEALQELDDAELAKFGITRRSKENLTVDTKVIDLGKAVKSVEKSQAVAAKAGKKAQALTGGFTVVESLTVIAIIGILATITIPLIGAFKNRNSVPPSAITMQKTDGEDRFTLVRVTEFDDSFAYSSKRAAYVLTDKKTGIQYVGVSGIGITEIGRHPSGKNNSVEDER